MSIDVAKQAPSRTETVPREAVSRRSGPVAATVLTAAAAAVALVAAVWFGTGWMQALWFTDGPRAAARESALVAARQAALNMTTMRLEDIPGSLALARSSMTGEILASSEKNQQQSEELAARTGVAMTSKVLGASLTALNSERDHAAALIVLQVTEGESGEQPANYRYTWNLEMAEAGGVWKAEQVASLTQPVLLDGPVPGVAQPQPAPAPAEPEGVR
ncbi:hypothetical protein AB0C65_12015 [Nocardia sp. NPDC048505]|uniref:hypothetical protein n=1 Tax=Nocardia sp. NPDC048505 TaxID=3155756 RepID=UPI0033F52C56